VIASVFIERFKRLLARALRGLGHSLARTFASDSLKFGLYDDSPAAAIVFEWLF
jgi:hypothetical protein